jgi:hypothetical protein
MARTSPNYVQYHLTLTHGGAVVVARVLQGVAALD